MLHTTLKHTESTHGASVATLKSSDNVLLHEATMLYTTCVRLTHGDTELGNIWLLCPTNREAAE